MSEEQDKCQFPKCAAPSDLIYLGKGLCDGHWEKLCKLDSKDMRKKLKIEDEKNESSKSNKGSGK